MDFPKDLTGLKFNKLTVLEKAGFKNKNTQWLCKCECGNTAIVGRGNLLSGKTKSCGCLRHREAVNKTHGKSKTRLYYVWRNMLNRCYDAKVRDYPHYGGRGIAVCDEWKNDFQMFYEWAVANGYDETAKRGENTLDRINTDGNYEPSNCRWVSEKVQANNKRNNYNVEYNGEKMTLKQLAELTGIEYKVLYKRICLLHWDVEKAATTKVREIKSNKHRIEDLEQFHKP